MVRFLAGFMAGACVSAAVVYGDSNQQIGFLLHWKDAKGLHLMDSPHDPLIAVNADDGRQWRVWFEDDTLCWQTPDTDKSCAKKGE